MVRGVKGSGKKPSTVTAQKEVMKVEQQQTGEMFRCRSCRSNRNWNYVGEMANGKHLHQCGFCKRVMVTDLKEIPRSNNPLDEI
jgi:hypothetical protein